MSTRKKAEEGVNAKSEINVSKTGVKIISYVTLIFQRISSFLKDFLKSQFNRLQDNSIVLKWILI